jgi:hypothetical protein
VIQIGRATLATCRLADQLEGFREDLRWAAIIPGEGGMQPSRSCSKNFPPWNRRSLTRLRLVAARDA